MPKNGLKRIRPHRRDYSILHTFGAGDPKSLPDDFTIYDGRPIPNQNKVDVRFNPFVRPLPFGCTGETTTFIGGLEDGRDYRPDDLYDHTPPFRDMEGRDIRDALQTAKVRGYTAADGSLGYKRTAYFNCYGVGPIDDFDAARIAIWINQEEKRGVSVGSWWYWSEAPEGILAVPASFDMNQASLHNWLVVGWKTIDGKPYLIGIPWCGPEFGDNGLVYVSRELYNALMAQPWTGAFTLTRTTTLSPVPIGFQAIVDHLVYWFRNLIKA